MSVWKSPAGKLLVTYSMNVHPSETLEEVRSAIREYAAPLAGRISSGAPFGLGLRLSAQAARELRRDASAVDSLGELLDRHRLFVFTLNGFPYGGFHAVRVKEKVFSPSWLQRERVQYTKDLAEVLVALSSGETLLTLSTVAGGFAPRRPVARQLQLFLSNLVQVAVFLVELRDRTGCQVMVCLEPEPFSTLSTVKRAVEFFRTWVYGRGVGLLCGMRDVGPAQAEQILRDHLGVCLDASHAAVGFDGPGESYRLLRSEGIPVGKVQLSSAPEVSDPKASPEAVARLRAFLERRYLHQVFAEDPNGGKTGLLDLGQLFAMPAAKFRSWLRKKSWRTHFHVPIHLERLGPLGTTQRLLGPLLDEVLADSSSRHLEIETYTWDVLPPREKDMAGKGSLLESLAAEFRWLEGELKKRGCTKAE